MDLLLILLYAGFCVLVFKIFRIPLTKWTVPTAILGGIVLIGAMLLLMNYNHPYGKYAKEAFVTVPIIPAVSGIVVSVDAEPNRLLKQGELLFSIDPKPFELEVARLEAELVEAEQQVGQTEASLRTAEARVAKAKAERDRAAKTFQRYSKGNKKGAGRVFSEQEVENRRQFYLAAEASLEAAQSEQTRAQLAFESNIDGVNTREAQLQAQLEAARYDLSRTQIRAPNDGYVTQVTLRPGMMASKLPLRPSMVFVPKQRRQISASFWQNSILRLEPGAEAEVILDAAPGKVFRGRLVSLLPAMNEGELQSGGTLISANRIATHGRAIGIIELEDDLDSYGLPLGVQGKAAVYTDHFHHVAVMRKVLLRMLGWINYAFPIK
ncbi:HlyD family secretion protein [Motiliproteus coralliicola]|uniref:HlyD family secretion protein n=1 Tax=Motiliproteus coralliicola TaxID=2283196 RepID=A0A369WD73_9GAMM|nr:HlyD family secretion protein [Motiliproteus coralliicola]RDE19129.1 HlyD family secretion protein [Motiliproteus coralliicola]